jgi:hypothetical protein
MVRAGAERGRTAESIGHKWHDVGWTIEEYRYLKSLPARDRRLLEQDIFDALDAPLEPIANGMTALAAEKIAELDELWRSQSRPSIRKTAELAGVDRDTVSDWRRRGWWTPPPR